MAFATQSTVAFGDTWSATQHNVMINNDIWLNTAFHVPLFPRSSGMAPSSGLAASALSQVQSSGAGTIKPEYQILSHDAGTDEGRIWTARVPRGYGSTLVIAGAFYMASATSGNVVVAAQVACQSDGDASFSAKVFATENSSTVAVPGSAGTLKYFTITMSNADSIAAADWIAIAFRRDADNASDTATGDLQLTMLDIYYSLA
jgi:hypothetical protein